MRLQKTYKPKDYRNILKAGELSINVNTLYLICENFEKLDKADRKKVNDFLFTANEINKEIEKLKNEIWFKDKARFKKELEIIEIFQKNNI